MAGVNAGDPARREGGVLFSSSAHSHVIELDRLSPGPVERWRCSCGEYGVNLPRVVCAEITAHRMESFPAVRRSLAR